MENQISWEFSHAEYFKKKKNHLLATFNLLFTMKILTYNLDVTLTAYIFMLGQVEIHTL